MKQWIKIAPDTRGGKDISWGCNGCWDNPSYHQLRRSHLFENNYADRPLEDDPDILCSIHGLNLRVSKSD